ncbi:MAG: hypothetical protein CSA83_02655, partial [Actinomycetales bacterium]
YSATDREKLKKVVTRPIQNEGALLRGPTAGVLAVLLAIGMWLAAMASYIVIRAIPSRVVTSSRPTWQIALAPLIPGAALISVQAVALTVLSAALLGLSAGLVAGLLAALLLIGLCFVAVNHAAVAAFSGWGRMTFLGLAILAAAAGLTSGVPGIVSWLASFSPVMPAIQIIRSIGSGASLTTPIGTLIFWLILGLVVGFVVIAKNRQLKPSQLT